MNADRSSKAVIAVFGVEAGTSSDFKFKLFVVVTSKSNADDSFVSILSLPPPPPLLNFLLTTIFWRFVGIGVTVDVDAITSHNALPFLRPNDTVVDFSFLPYDIDDLLVVL